MTEEQLAYIEANVETLSFDRGEDGARARAAMTALIAEVRRLRMSLASIGNTASEALREAERLGYARARPVDLTPAGPLTIINRPGSTEFLFGEPEQEEPHR